MPRADYEFPGGTVAFVVAARSAAVQPDSVEASRVVYSARGGYQEEF